MTSRSHGKLASASALYRRVDPQDVVKETNIKGRSYKLIEDGGRLGGSTGAAGRSVRLDTVLHSSLLIALVKAISPCPCYCGRHRCFQTPTQLRTEELHRKTVAAD